MAQILHEAEELQVALDAQGRPVVAGCHLGEDEFIWLVPPHHAVICAALNYRQHYAGLAEKFSTAPYQSPPRAPCFFIKPENTITAHNALVQFPDSAEAMVAGAALAVVMAESGFKIPAEAAMDYVAGYTVFNDFSLPEVSFFRPPVISKCFDSSGPLGPAIINKAAIADPHLLKIQTMINGEVKQQASTADMILSLPQLIQAVSDFMTLQADDVLVTGFPAARPKVQVGDEVQVMIAGVGTLTSYIVSEAEYYANGLSA